MSVLDLLDPEAFTVLLLGGTGAITFPASVPVTTVSLDPADPEVILWTEGVSLADAVAVIVRPDGHVHRVVSDLAGSERVGADLGALLGVAEGATR